jgi:hypothetical protein
MIAQKERLAPLPWSAVTQQIIRTYAPEHPEQDRQLNEVTILAVLGLLLFLSALLLAIAGWLTSLVSTDVERVIRVLGALLVGGLGVGVCLHVVRFCDATICARAERSGDADARTTLTHRWPRASSDVDFMVMLVVSAGLLLH